MDFELSEDQELLRDGLRQLLEGACTLPHVRKIAYEGDGRDEPLWEQLASNGWIASQAPEALGGGGLGFEEAVMIGMEVGRAVLHLPLVETLLVSRTLERAGATALLESQIAHAHSATLALDELSDDYDGESTGVTAEAAGDGWRLRGSQRGAPFGPLAARCLVQARLPDGSSGLCYLDTGAPGVSWTEIGAMDRTVRRYDLDLDGVELDSESLLAGTSIDDLADEWRVLMAAQTQGACRRVLEMTVEYVKKREQFGRPVGSNQAVKVRLADSAGHVELMQAALYHAAVKIRRGASDRALAARLAKLQTSAPGAFVATQAVHCHGAIGYTWEQDVHLFVKRIKTNELLLGGENVQLERIADTVLAAGF